jgi:TATA-box binding protein (TBP) (component of TFIID and TFIIIB)
MQMCSSHCIYSLNDRLNSANRYIEQNMGRQLAGKFACGITLLRIENIVGGSYVCVPLPRGMLAQFIPLTCKLFNGPSVSLCFGNPESSLSDERSAMTVLTFKPGSIQGVGAQNINVLRLTFHRFCDQLRTVGLRPYVLFVSKENVVATSSLNHTVEIHKMHKNVTGFHTWFDPMLFPGLILMHKQYGHQIVMTLFDEGNLTALGLLSPDIADDLFLEVAGIAACFRGQPIWAGPSSIKRKSDERFARLCGEESSHIADRSIRGKRLNITSEIRVAIKEFVSANKASMSDEKFVRTIDDHIQNIVKTIKNKPDESQPAVQPLTSTVTENDVGLVQLDNALVFSTEDD